VDASCRSVPDLYERHAREYDRARGRSLQEKRWLERFLALIPPSGTVLDIGCGMGEPMARYLVDAGISVVGIDSSQTLIGMCRTRLPAHRWIVGDMRELALGEQFDGILAWDSFFHLEHEDQRRMFPQFAAHARPGAPLMFTSGPAQGEAIGSFGGDSLYHASLDPADYESLLAKSAFAVREFCPKDTECGDHTVWLATYGSSR
jgi:2-polyprenyl-3-methyl-5-hydroxy-6-metoxy-1,4-benzoquinol methylase